MKKMNSTWLIFFICDKKTFLRWATDHAEGGVVSIGRKRSFVWGGPLWQEVEKAARDKKLTKKKRFCLKRACQRRSLSASIQIELFRTWYILVRDEVIKKKSFTQNKKSKRSSLQWKAFSDHQIDWYKSISLEAIRFQISMFFFSPIWKWLQHENQTKYCSAKTILSLTQRPTDSLLF